MSNKNESSNRYLDLFKEWRECEFGCGHSCMPEGSEVNGEEAVTKPQWTREAAEEEREKKRHRTRNRTRCTLS